MNAPSTSNVTLLELTLKRVAKIWWALFWRGVLLALGGGLVAGFLEGFFGAMVGMPRISVFYLNVISGFVVGIPAGLCCVYLILRKNFGEFSIGLVASHPAT